MTTIFNKVLAASLIMASMPTLQAESNEQALMNRLFRAIENGNIEDMRKAIADGADVNAKAKDGTTALIHAVYKSPKIVKYLVEHGADVNAKTEDGTTALIKAADGSPKKVKYLVAHGADVNAKDNYGLTPLIAVASNQNHPELAIYLVKHGADVNAKTKDGKTALIRAAYGNPKIVKYLVEHGADVNAEDDIGTALINAIFNGRKRIVEYLIKHGAHVNNVQMKQLWPYDQRHSKANGLTPLMAAALLGHIDIVKLLIEAGANPNEKNTFGNTPLHAAVGNHRIKKSIVKTIIHYLVTHGADINAKNKDGSSIILRAQTESDKELYTFLRNLGAKKPKSRQ